MEIQITELEQVVSNVPSEAELSKRCWGPGDPAPTPGDR